MQIPGFSFVIQIPVKCHVFQEHTQEPMFVISNFSFTMYSVDAVTQPMISSKY